MITIYFHGLLKKYGEKFTLEVRNPAEAVRLLCIQIPGLESTIKKGNWHVLRGRLDEQDSVSEEALTLEFGNQNEMHLMPAVEGAGSGGGWLSVIVGVVLIAVGAITFGATSAVGMAMIAGGAGLAVGGIVMLTTKMPSAELNQESVDSKSSFLLNKPTNSSTQGVAVPRGYGRCLVGSVQVSVSLAAEDIKPDSSDVLQRKIDIVLGARR